MSRTFLKINTDTDQADFLASKHPNAFILLYFIARRARRIAGQADGLEIGECYVGDWAIMGLSRQNYRTALNVLVFRNFIKISETNRTRKKSTIKVTTTGTKVKILNSDIWDINSEEGNHSSNHYLTTAQPLPNHEQDRIRRFISNDINQEIAPSAKTHPASPIRPKDPLSFDFEKMNFIGISEEDLSNWKVMYPYVDIASEMLKAGEWIKSNPSKSNKKNWRKFLTGWFGRTNDKLENKKAFQSGFSNKNQDRRTQDINGKPISSPHEGRF